MDRLKVAMLANGPDSYVGMLDDNYSFTMKREYGMLDDGYQLSGQWVLRGDMNVYIDRDTNRHDLAERNLLVLS